jgi:transposase-like protein
VQSAFYAAIATLVGGGESAIFKIETFSENRLNSIQKLAMSIRNWKMALNRFMIQFQGHLANCI